MNVLSFTLSEELLVAGLSWVSARPAKLSDPTVTARIANREIIVRLLFINDSSVETDRVRPDLLRIEDPALAGCTRAGPDPASRKLSGRNILLVRTLDTRGHILVAIISLVNLLHTVERFFLVTHLVVNET